MIANQAACVTPSEMKKRETIQDLIAGIDIGGTKIAVAIASADGQVTGRNSFPADPDRSPHEFMNQALETLVRRPDKLQGKLASIGIINLQDVSVVQAGLGKDSVIHGALALAARALQPVRT